MVETRNDLAKGIAVKPNVVEVAQEIIDAGKLGPLEEVFEKEIVSKGRTLRVIDNGGNVLTDINATGLQDLVEQLQKLREADVD